MESKFIIIEEVAEDHQIARDNDGRDKAVDLEESGQAGEEGRIRHWTRSEVQRKKLQTFRRPPSAASGN